MTGADRTVQLLALVVTPSRRTRFLEEWRADLAAARSLGLSPADVALAAARVAVLLLRFRVRDRFAAPPGPAALVTAGILLGAVLAVTDAPLDELVPFVLLALAVRGWRALRTWIGGGR